MIHKDNLSAISTKNTTPCIYYGDVTPEIAAKWLTYNTENRNIRPVILNRYVEAMNNGLWEENYSVLRFRNDGVLLDGQHRLQAIVKSGKTFPFIIITGQEKTHHMDDGATRSIKDLITLFNYHVPSYYKDSHVISCANLALSLTVRKESAPGKFSKSDPKEVEDWIGRHEEAIKYVFCTAKLKCNRPGGSTYDMRASSVTLPLVTAYEAGVDMSILDAWIAGATKHEYTEDNFGKNAMLFEMYYDREYRGRNNRGLADYEVMVKICIHNIYLTESGQLIKYIRPYDKYDFPIPR